MLMYLTNNELDYLEISQWNEYVGQDTAIWIKAEEQLLLVIDNFQIARCYPCSTASAGLGNKYNSYCTPLGWHEVAEKIGENLPEGSVFKARKWTGEIWNNNDYDAIREEYILSRILRLSGLEEGYNQGGEADSLKRNIYIHGTNMEELIGKPSSKGCIRLTNRDVIELFDLISVGNRVLISKDLNVTLSV